MANLEFKLLGGVKLLQNGVLVSELKTQKGLGLLCYLALSARPVARSTLAAMFWPDKPEADAYSNLRKILLRLKPLGQHLKITHTTLALQPDCGLDVADFEASALVASDIAGLERAVALYQGEFMEGFVVDGAPFFDEWLQAQRSRLQARALELLETLMAHFDSRADYPTALRHARRLLALQPWHEETHRAVMRLLAVSGQRSAALIQFEHCQAALAAQLGVAPTAATVQLYEQIKRGDLLETRDRPTHNLPAQTTPFVGREPDLAALNSYLTDESVRLVTILGLGGIGKTRLALAAAAAQLDDRGRSPRFPDGVCFVALAGVEAPNQLVIAISEALGLRFMSEVEPETQLLDHVRPKVLLLVLDNFEQLRSQAGMVSRLLNAAPKIKLLITSRERLNLQAEHLWKAEGLNVPLPGQALEASNAKAVAGYEAIELFCDHARRARSDFSLSTENLASVVAICRLVHGIPLGIVLAASWLDVYTPQEIAVEIQANLDFLARDYEDLPRRQRSLWAAFNHSWHLLPDQEQRVFQRLSVFRGGFTRLAAQAVAGASARDLQHLVNKSLLAVSAEGRYALHELVREFGAEILARQAEAEAEVRQHHSDYYCDFLREWTEHWTTARQLEALAAVAREADNVRLAWLWAVEHEQWLQLATALPSWLGYLAWGGQDQEGEATFRELAEWTEHCAAKTPDAPADLYYLWATAVHLQGEFTNNNHQALEILYRALALFEYPQLTQRDTRAERAAVLKSMGNRYYGLDRAAARQVLDESLALARACHHQLGISLALHDLGMLDWATGHYRQALTEMEAAVAMHRARGDGIMQTAALGGLAWIYQSLGELSQAVALRHQVLEFCRQMNTPSALPNAMVELSYTLSWQGEFVEEGRWADEALAIFLQLTPRGGEGYLRLGVATARMYLGQYERAQQEAEVALDSIQRDAGHGVEGTIHWVLGCLAIADADWPRARAAFAEARRLYEAVQDNFLGLALSGPGYVACCEAKWPEARPHFVEALQFALNLRDYQYLVASLPGVALYLSGVGELVRALEVWGLCLRQPFISNSRWYADVVGRRLEAATATISPGERQAACERGRALELWSAVEALAASLPPD